MGEGNGALVHQGGGEGLIQKSLGKGGPTHRCGRTWGWAEGDFWDIFICKSLLPNKTRAKGEYTPKEKERGVSPEKESKKRMKKKKAESHEAG